MIWSLWVVDDGAWRLVRESMSWGDAKSQVVALGKQGIRAACCRDGAEPSAKDAGDVRAAAEAGHA